MTQSVLFNGTVLTRAGGATKVDTSGMQNFSIGGVGNVGVVGLANSGDTQTVKKFTSSSDMVAHFKSGDLADAADLLFNPMNDARIPGGAVNVYAVRVDDTAPATRTFTDGSNNVITVAAVERSSTGGTVQVAFAAGTPSTSRTVTIGSTQSLIHPVDGAEASASIGGTSELLAISATSGTPSIVVSSLSFSDGTATFLYSLYPTIGDLVSAVTAAGRVTLTLGANGNPSVKCIDLDYLTLAMNASGGAVKSLYGTNARLVTYINNNYSDLVVAERATASATQGAVAAAPLAALTTAPSAVADTSALWTSALALLEGVRVSQVVPLASAATAGSVTYASIRGLAKAHVKSMSSSNGKNERQLYIGLEGTLAALVAEGFAINNENVVLVGQKITRNDASGASKVFPEWGLAAVMAGGRAGAPLGEPLVFKGIEADAVSSDASWSMHNTGNIEDLIKAGVTVAINPAGQGIKFDRVITTYTRSDNDALTEESIVMGWKTVAYDLRTQLENVFTGVRGTPSTVSAIKGAATTLLGAFRDSGQIVDSILADGTVLNAYRDMTVTLDGDIARLNVTISPVSGINFQLQTLLLVPATIAA